jgi:hypothetical protein
MEFHISFIEFHISFIELHISFIELHICLSSGRRRGSRSDGGCRRGAKKGGMRGKEIFRIFAQYLFTPICSKT